MEKEDAAATYLGPDFCVRIVDEDGINYHYYLINRDTTQEDLVDPLPLKRLSRDFASSVASSGSMVYVTGGFDISQPQKNIRLTDVHCIDPHCPEEGWKALPHMNFGREDHGSFFHDDKLYVWCGCYTKGGTFAEVYDTKLKEWKCLDDLPLEVDLRGIESTWRNYVGCVFGDRYSSAFVGRIVYSLCRKLGPTELYAYDPFSGCEPVPVISSEGENLLDFLPNHDYEMFHEVIPQHCLLSLGDDILGVVYLEVEIKHLLKPHLKKHGSMLKRLHFSKFRMKRNESGGDIVAKLVDHSSYYIIGFDISKCVALEPLLPREKVVTECNIVPETVEMTECSIIPSAQGQDMLVGLDASTLQATLSSLLDGVQTIIGAQERLEADIGSLKTRMTKIELDIGDSKVEVGTLSSDMRKVKESANKIENVASELKKNIQRLGKRTDVLLSNQDIEHRMLKEIATASNVDTKDYTANIHQFGENEELILESEEEKNEQALVKAVLTQRGRRIVD